MNAWIVRLAGALGLWVGVGTPARAIILYAFSDPAVERPNGPVIMDASGAFYGVALTSAPKNYGAVYRLARTAVGQPYVLTVLHTFVGADGAYPQFALAMDAGGSLYGVTTSGGPVSQNCPAGHCGVVFKLDPPAAGQTVWAYSDIATVGTGTTASSAPLLGTDGSVYGSAYGSAAGNDGVVYRLTPPAAGQSAWTNTVLYAFAGPDGRNPYGGLALDSGGIVYGTTALGGSGMGTPVCPQGCGEVFKLLPPAAGMSTWRLGVLHRFVGSDGYAPYTGVVIGPGGTLYGTTQYWVDGAGTVQPGSVFQLTRPAGSMMWGYGLVHGFGTDGAGPTGLAVDPAGNLIGCTRSGGSGTGAGTYFELAPPAAGSTSWTETGLINLNMQDGAYPVGVLLGADTHVYGANGDLGPSQASHGTLLRLALPGH